MAKLLKLDISKWQVFLLGGDLLVLCFSIMAGFYFNPMTGQSFVEFVQRYRNILIILGIIYIAILYIADLYDHYQDYRLLVNCFKLIVTSILASIIVIAIGYLAVGKFIGRVFIIVQVVSVSLVLLLWRYVFSSASLPQRLKRKVLLVGAGRAGRHMLAAIREQPNCGLEVKGFIDDDDRKEGKQIQNVPVLGGSCRLAEVVREHKIDLAVVCITHEKSEKMLNELNQISWYGCQVTDMPSIYSALTGKLPVGHISELWIFLNNLNSRKLYYRHIKRLTDILVSIVLLLPTLPLFAFIALAIKLEDRGSVFFLQERLGQYGKPFKIIKFRTMIEDAEQFGPQWASKSDPRITWVGQILRRLRLDELPQLINILKGNMSIIGPRPERESFIKEFLAKVPYYNYRLLVKPGLTGWAQVMYPYASSMDQTREKLKFDLYYLKNMGFFLDVVILLKTIRIVLFGKGQ